MTPPAHDEPLTATVIRLPTERSARRGSDDARRRHPAAGGWAPVVHLERHRAERQAIVEAHFDAIANPVAGPDWVSDAHRAIDRFAALLAVGRADDLLELCDRAIEHLAAAAPEIDDADAVAELTEHVRRLRVAAWQAPRPS